MFEFEDNLSTGFHDVFLSKYSVSKLITFRFPHTKHTQHRKKNKNTNTQFCKNVYFR